MGHPAQGSVPVRKPFSYLIFTLSTTNFDRIVESAQTKNFMERSHFYPRG